MPKITNDWLNVIGEEFTKDYYQNLRRFLYREYQTQTIYPKADDIFNAFHFTPYSKVKVLILGQDPYHNENQAMGLSFAVSPQQKQLPPSLVNIYKELHDDLGCRIPNNGWLKKWADQGVLMLNAVLTVRAHLAFSHQKKGWENFTDAVIKAVNEIDRPVVHILWGKPAQAKQALINNPRHLILCAAHPSPLSAARGFFGSRPFSKTNQFLQANGVEPIDWQIEDI
ncbi:uracil-DNA glycosylase [bacterium]|nr:uracil-DNA glycosylase [bacterium]